MFLDIFRPLLLELFCVGLGLFGWLFLSNLNGRFCVKFLAPWSLFYLFLCFAFLFAIRRLIMLFGFLFWFLLFFFLFILLWINIVVAFIFVSIQIKTFLLLIIRIIIIVVVYVLQQGLQIVSSIPENGLTLARPFLWFLLFFRRSLFCLLIDGCNRL